MSNTPGLAIDRHQFDETRSEMLLTRDASFDIINTLDLLLSIIYFTPHQKFCSYQQVTLLPSWTTSVVNIISIKKMICELIWKELDLRISVFYLSDRCCGELSMHCCGELSMHIHHRKSDIFFFWSNHGTSRPICSNCNALYCWKKKILWQFYPARMRPNLDILYRSSTGLSCYFLRE